MNLLRYQQRIKFITGSLQGDSESTENTDAAALHLENQIEMKKHSIADNEKHPTELRLNKTVLRHEEQILQDGCNNPAKTELFYQSIHKKAALLDYLRLSVAQQRKYVNKQQAEVKALETAADNHEYKI
jgi:hypothetical protein